MNWADEALIGLDLETLGPDPMTTVPCQFALVLFRRRERESYRHGLIEPGLPIPAEASAIHGITDEMVKERGGSLEDSVHGIRKSLEAAVGRSQPIVGCNVVFDLTVLNESHRRLFGEPMFAPDWAGLVIDILVIDRALDRYRKGSRKLTALCEHYGVTLTEAHHACADAEAAVRVAIAQADRYPEVGKASLPDLQVMQKAWRKEWAIGYSAYRVSKGESALGPAEQEWPVMGVGA